MKISARWLGVLAALWTSLAAAVDVERTGGPYVPTPAAVVNAMLELAGVGPRDFVVDLGSGDGRIVLAAAARHGAGGMGVDIDPELVARANASAQRAGLARRVRFVREDVMAADLSRATVVTLYLMPEMMRSLRPKLLAQLNPGTRVVSHDFGFGGWQPDRSVTVETREKYDRVGTWTSEVYLWIVPAAVAGEWRVERAGDKAGAFRLEIRQDFQRVEGRLWRGERPVTLREARLEGDRLAFTVAAGDGRRERYTATVARDRMRGEAREGGIAVARWSAARMP
jgi:SAM-dependent methyltransferase